MNRPMEKANLGMASTEELFRELISRFLTSNYPHGGTQMIMSLRAVKLAEMLGGLDTLQKEYRTIDN